MDRCNSVIPGASLAVVREMRKDTNLLSDKSFGRNINPRVDYSIYGVTREEEK
jgi:hypothetical protein